MPVLSMTFVGVPELSVDGVPVQLERRNSLALLAYLVLTNRPHSREELTTHFAGEVSEEAARKRLRNSLADLVEHGLGPYLQTSRQSVAFDTTSPHALDISLLDDVSRNGDATDLADLSWAAERCDLELLAGLTIRDAPAFETWLSREREYRGQQLRDLSQQHLRHLLDNEQFEAGARLAQRLLAVEPWNVAVHRTLMRLLARDGQIAGALAQYDQCVGVLADELGIEPEPETTELYERLRAGSVAPRHNLPATFQPGEIVGRDEQIRVVAGTLVDPGCRILTIVGMGGSGKTSLALAAAARLAGPAAPGDPHPFADGITVVNLTETQGVPTGGTDQSADRRIATAIGFALGMAFYGHLDRLSQVIAYLQSKRMLLVLDNGEQLRAGSMALLAILRSAPGVTILATSRQALGVVDEWVQDLGGLRVPESIDGLEETAASQLFLRDARRAGFQIEQLDLPAVVRICELTGGWPLATKIAAGWLGALTCAEIVRELEEGGALLHEPVSATGVRRTSLHSIVAASYEALPERDRRALSRMAVFSGSFDLQAATAIGVTSPSLVALSQRSLLERGDRERYALHPLVSQYALEQLSNDVADDLAARAAHARYFAGLVAEVTPALYTSPNTHAVVAGEQSNVQAAWRWAVAQRDIDLIGQLLEGMAVWHERAGLHREWTGELSTAITQFRSGDDEPGQPEMLARLLVAKAESLLWQGELDSAFPLLSEARRTIEQAGALGLEALISYCEGRLLRFRGGESAAAADQLMQARVLARATHQPRIEASSYLQLSFAAMDSEEYADAESYLHRAEEAFQALSDRLSSARLTCTLGRLLVLQGEFVRAQVVLDQSVHMARAFGDQFMQGYSQMYLGIVSDVAFGRHQDADAMFKQSFTIASQTGDPYFDVNVHRASGRNAMHAGDFDRAEGLFNHALERARDVGNTRTISDMLCCLAQLADARGQYALAEDRAQRALQMATEQGRRNASAVALLCLGEVYERLGRVSDSNAAYGEAFGLAETLQIPYLSCDASAGLARVALATGDIELALRHVEGILPYLQQNALAGSEEPALVADTCHRVLDAVRDRRAAEALRIGADLIGRRLDGMPESDRDRYLDAFPVRRVIRQRWLDLAGSPHLPEGMQLHPITALDLGVMPDVRPGGTSAPGKDAGQGDDEGEQKSHLRSNPAPGRRRRRPSHHTIRRHP